MSRTVPPARTVPRRATPLAITRTLTRAISVIVAGGCAGAPRIAQPPPAEAANAITIAPERVRRGDAPVPVAADTERPEGRVRAAVLRQRSVVQQCYERILPASPEAAGAITVAFTVETQGLVHDATAETDATALRPTRDCLLTHIRATRIEGLDHALQVTWTFRFENPPLEITAPETVLTPHTRIVPPDAAAAIGAGSGELTAGELLAVAGTRQSDLLGCYTTLLRTAHRAEGTARFELTIAPDGSPGAVSMVSVDDPVQPAADCIANVLQGLHFRNTGRRTRAVVPVALRLRDTPSPAR